MTAGPIGTRLCAILTALNGAMFAAGLILGWLDRRTNTQ